MIVLLLHDPSLHNSCSVRGRGAKFFWKCHESDGDWLNNRCDGETSELIKIVPYFFEFLVHSYYIAQSTRYLDICNAIIRDRTTSWKKLNKRGKTEWRNFWKTRVWNGMTTIHDGQILQGSSLIWRFQFHIRLSYLGCKLNPPFPSLLITSGQ